MRLLNPLQRLEAAVSSLERTAEIMADTSVVNTGSEAQMKDLIGQLKQAIADGLTRENSQAQAFEVITNQWVSYAQGLKEKLSSDKGQPVGEDHTNDIDQLLGALVTARTIGLGNLPAALVPPPSAAQSPAAEPPLGGAITATQITDQGTTVQPADATKQATETVPVDQAKPSTDNTPLQENTGTQTSGT